MNAPQIIVIGGSPGSGKSTLLELLQTHFRNPPTIEFSSVRNLYLDPDWKRQSPEEEAMAAQILHFALERFVPRGPHPILMTDFREHRLEELTRSLAPYRHVIFTLYALDDGLVRERIQARSEGFTNADAAVEWNRVVRERAELPRERKLAVDGLTPTEVFRRCLEFLSD